MSSSQKREDFFISNQSTIVHESLKTNWFDSKRHQAAYKAAIQNLLEFANSQGQTIDKAPSLAEFRQQKELYEMHSAYLGWFNATKTKESAKQEGRKLTCSEKDHITASYVKFNDSLREIFNTWGSSISQTDIMYALDQVVAISDAPHYRDEMTSTIIGVRNEILTELALTNMGLEFRRATPEEDSMGTDYILIINGREVKIDIKSSVKSARDKNRKNASHNDSTIAICPFSSKTLQEIPTILPADPYHQMFKPAQEMLWRMRSTHIINNEEFDQIESDLIAQQMKSRANQK